MKKIKIWSMMMLSVMMLSITMTSCSKEDDNERTPATNYNNQNVKGMYDDDIKNLQGQIDNLAQAVKDIQAQLQKGYLLSAVNQTPGDVTITLSNGDKYTIANSTSWDISTDGYWIKDNEKTNYKAIIDVNAIEEKIKLLESKVNQFSNR